MNEPDAFIVTVTNDERNFEQDMELPADMQISDLSAQILMTLKSIHEDIFSDWRSCCLECGCRILNQNDTLLKAGVFDGSIIVVREGK